MVNRFLALLHYYGTIEIFYPPNLVLGGYLTYIFILIYLNTRLVLTQGNARQKNPQTKVIVNSLIKPERDFFLGGGELIVAAAVK